MKRQKKILHTSANQKRAGMGILRSHERDFKQKMVRDNEGQYVKE